MISLINIARHPRFAHPQPVAGQGLTAMPIYNYGSDFFHVLDPLLPGCLGT
ncbi:hypothetical protein [Stenotrophomonas sp. 169]|uniref:hypothetical protein n=1 Tax=Stenotrophomonas sp. 169 TaxID=2770322 RepID=UPI001CB77756|nr:hypothetical protein [Stenotrophomonas sp. 169]